MKITALVLCAITVVLAGVAYFRGHSLPIKGLKVSGKMLLAMAPIFLAAFLMAGQLQVLLPELGVGRWLGEKGGLKTIFIGSVAGALTPGGPMVVFPIALSLFKSGASVGCVVAYLVGWVMWGVNSLALEFSLLGSRLTLAKRLTTLVFPPLAGLLAQLFFRS